MIKFDDTTHETAEYAAFVDKFKPKKTTDDCYTPANIYEAVRDWAVTEYGLQGRPIVRPFFPGGDYENAEYPEGCVVLDNPPFSIVSQICRFYDARGIDYFMFAPGLTLFSINSGKSNYVVIGDSIRYDNGALVHTGFVTNMGTNRVILSPELDALIAEANDQNINNTTPQSYTYPDAVISSATLKRLVTRGVGLRVPQTDAVFIRALDHQRENKKAIFGGGFLLSERAAAERAAAERAAAERAAAERAAAERAAAERAASKKLESMRWKLSKRELEMQKQLGASRSVI